MLRKVQFFQLVQNMAVYPVRPFSIVCNKIWVFLDGDEALVVSEDGKPLRKIPDSKLFKELNKEKIT